MGCLGKHDCSHCSKKGLHELFVIGVYCLKGWRAEAKHANSFFVNMDGSPYIRIANEEAWAKEMYRKQHNGNL